MSLSGKVIIITGASKGIGKACAQRVAREGASVVINYNSNSAPAEELVGEIGSDRALAIQGDVGKIPDIEKIIKATVDKFGKIDSIVLNAGLMLMKDLESTTEQDFETMFDLNVKGPYFMAQVRACRLSTRLIASFAD
jgi:3-oxoacyl-[acyl-carrier protein] reductase